MTFIRAALAALALSLAAASPAFAEDAKSSAATDAVAAATNSVAAPAAAETKVSREVFEQWELECFEPAVNGLNCQIAQKLITSDRNQLVLVLSLAYSPEAKKHLLQLALPLNFLLKPGVEIAIGEAKTIAAVDRCSAQGCFIEGFAGDELVEAMIKGAKGDVKFMASADKRIVIPFSLMGFTKAYEKMKSLNAAS